MGNARDYIQAHPKCNRVRLVSESEIRCFDLTLFFKLRDISLGLVYLHFQSVTHGLA
jgi:hypothetical protein